MTALAGRIARLIAAQGPLSIAQFTAMALHDPTGGYYATRDPLGRAGDFTTSPEISQMFGELIGAWLAQVWRDRGAPGQARLVELGPGRGTLMADLLRVARQAKGFADAVEIVLVETSAALAAIQQERLRESGARIRWTARLEDALGDAPLFLIANEFFDALPIRQYVRTERGWYERMVALDARGALAFALAPVPAAGLAPPAERGEAEVGAVYEVSSAANALMEEIARNIGGHGGAALIVDYGHSGTGFGDTLQAVRAHKPVAILESPGDADLSAHVDFAALAAATAAGGAQACGPATQGAWLRALGIEARADQLARANPAQAAAIAEAADRLTGPGRMGDLFKALAIVPRGAPRPPGF